MRTYDVTNANLLALASSSLVQGTFPSYANVTVPATSVAGYTSQAFSCHVVSRCLYGAVNCDAAADIALLDCADRDAHAAWLPVASSDPGTGPVEMYWFHELLSMPATQPAAGSSATAFDEFQHYTALTPTPAGEKVNWHYISGITNALLPLKSIPWSNGTPRTRTPGRWTDLFGCHGTSGSGILQRNAAGNLELLGPAIDGGGWANTRLCNDPDAFLPTQSGLSYGDNAATLAMQSRYSRALFFDRNPIVYLPPGGPIFTQ